MLSNFQIYTDSKWLIFIINQIINNSVKYKTDNPVLEINGSKTDSVIQLEIKDNGIGIRESEIGRVFQKGFTGSNGRNRRGATGMGLYICKELCDRLGIEIKIDSEFNEYTSVKILFPNNPNITKL